jgi:hypothetical protein
MNQSLSTSNCHADVRIVIKALEDREAEITAAIQQERSHQLEMGRMLSELQDSGDWRERAESWSEYLDISFEGYFTRARAVQLIGLHDGLGKIVRGYELLKGAGYEPKALPNTERKMRDLTPVGKGLSPDKEALAKAVVWDAAIQADPERVSPSHRVVREIVKQAEAMPEMSKAKHADLLASAYQKNILDSLKAAWRDASEATRQEFLEWGGN